MRAVRGGLAALVALACNFLIQAVLAPAILKHAGQETLGAYATLLQAVGYLSLLDTCVIAATTRFLAASYDAATDQETFTRVFSTGRTLSLCTNILFAISALICSLFLNHLLKASAAVQHQAKIGLLVIDRKSVV